LNNLQSFYGGVQSGDDYTKRNEQYRALHGGQPSPIEQMYGPVWKPEMADRLMRFGMTGTQIQTEKLKEKEMQLREKQLETARLREEAYARKVRGDEAARGAKTKMGGKGMTPTQEQLGRAYDAVREAHPMLAKEQAYKDEKGKFGGMAAERVAGLALRYMRDSGDTLDYGTAVEKAVEAMKADFITTSHDRTWGEWATRTPADEKGKVAEGERFKPKGGEAAPKVDASKAQAYDPAKAASYPAGILLSTKNGLVWTLGNGQFKVVE
jgi:hypothetical protein